MKQHDRVVDGETAEIEETPQAGGGKGRACEKRPVAQPRDADRRREHDREIDEQRPVIGRGRGDQRRRRHRADEPDAGERLSVQQRRGDRRKRDQAEQREGEAGTDEAVEPVGGVDRAEKREGAGRRQDRGDVRAGKTTDRQHIAGAPDDFAGTGQHDAEQTGENEPYFGAEYAGFDRITDQEQGAESEREAADPHRPACTNRGLDVELRRDRGRCRFGARCVRWWPGIAVRGR